MRRPKTKTALVTGALGQDGSYLSEWLCGQGYRVVGTSHRPVPAPHEHASMELCQLDLGDSRAVRLLVEELRPDEIYNLASRSSSGQLFDAPLATADINGTAVVRFLEAIRELSPATRFCQAASSEIFAGVSTSPQDERSAVQPINAYGASKTYAMHMVQAYRRAFGLHASTAILYNHESPRRGLQYVTRKIARAVAMISCGRASELVLGPLDTRRDWGFAGDYVEGMWRMLQQPKGDDFVLATGETHSIGEFCEIAFGSVGLDYRKYVRVDAALVRRLEGVILCGNPAKAEKVLGWRRTIGFEELVKNMVQAGCREMQRQSMS